MVGVTQSGWMLYGAYGATGKLIVEEAMRRGQRPLLSGRDAGQLAELGRSTGLPFETLKLDDTASLRTALTRVRVVLNAAGPYKLTGPPLRAACLDAGCSYLDINGEVEDFRAAMEMDAAARAKDIAIVPGVGYGVLFGECLAAELASRLPDANWLRLSLDTRNSTRSRGASLSRAAAISGGAYEIRDHVLRQRALAFNNWRSPGTSAESRNFCAAPLAEIVAAYHSTRISSIVAGIPLPRAAASVIRFAGPALGKLLAWRARRATGANVVAYADAAVDELRSRIWAEAGNVGGRCVAAVLETGEGYRAAAAAAVRAVELQLQMPRRGALTPVQAFGSGIARLVPGTHIRELSVGAAR